MTHKLVRKRFGRRSLLVAAAASAARPFDAHADDGLDAGGLTFRDFAVLDNGASFNRGDPISAGAPNHVSSRVLSVDSARGVARVRFDSIRVEIALPLGWQATEDWERGVGFSSDKRYRLIVWRVDFSFEGVNDAEHYAATKAGAIRARRPAIQADARKLKDGTFLVVYGNVPGSQGDVGTRVVFDLVMPSERNPKEGVLLTLGLPTVDGERGLKLLALLRQNIRVDR